jgi:4-diphosphocytidyl-2-C-methyl-D-erythritol kinase
VAEPASGQAIAVRHARAKINLWLNVVGRRGDGYHLLESLIAFVDLADTLAVREADRLVLELDGPFAAELADDPDNLVLRAARCLAERAAVPARAAIRLGKHIPVAAGLGGGSADAAATLRALADLWRVAVPEQTLFEIAQSLGADVPMCLAGRAALATGTGEHLAPAPPLPQAAILLVNPGKALPTREVFAAYRGPFSPERPLARPWRDLADLAAELARRGNDLVTPAISLRPAIEEVLASLRHSRGARYAGMSGSGATCFALYDTSDAARHAAASLPSAWWRHAGRLIG